MKSIIAALLVAIVTMNAHAQDEDASAKGRQAAQDAQVKAAAEKARNEQAAAAQRAAEARRAEAQREAAIKKLNEDVDKPKK